MNQTNTSISEEITINSHKLQTSQQNTPTNSQIILRTTRHLIN